MRGLGRKLVAIQTEARCPKSNTWSTPPSRDDCSRPSSRHVAAGREHDSKQCRTPSSLCREPSRCALAFRLGRLRRRHYQRGRQRLLAPVRTPRSAQPPRGPTHLRGPAARADSALRRRRPATEASLRWFGDGFIAVVSPQWQRSSPGIHSASTPKLFIFRTKVD